MADLGSSVESVKQQMSDVSHAVSDINFRVFKLDHNFSDFEEKVEGLETSVRVSISVLELLNIQCSITMAFYMCFQLCGTQFSLYSLVYISNGNCNL